MSKFVTLLHGAVIGMDFVQYEMFVARVDDILMVEVEKRIDGGEGHVLHPVDLTEEVADKFDTATFFIEKNELRRIHPFGWNGATAWG